MKVALATSLTILIFAGSVPLLIQSSEGVTQGFKVCKTPKGDLFIPKDQECPKGSSATYSGRLTIEFTDAGLVHSITREVRVHAESEIVGSLDQDGRFDLSSTSGTGTCIIFTDPNDRQVFIGTPKFRLTGDNKGVAFITDLFISARCSIPNVPFGGFALQNSHVNGFKSEGGSIDNRCIKLNEFELSCSRHWQWILTLSPTSSTSNSGCLIDTDKSDDLVGTSNGDCIEGKGGNDKILGLAGNDKLNGGEGKDILLGGDGNDELTGGPGPDTFQCGPGNDKITDFSPSQKDKKTSDCEQF